MLDVGKIHTIGEALRAIEERDRHIEHLRAELEESERKRAMLHNAVSTTSGVLNRFMGEVEELSSACQVATREGA